MHEMENQIFMTRPESLPTRRENSNVKQALKDRLLISEAIVAVGRMIRGYANSGQAGKAYIGAMADLLMRYPREVALRCVEPFGVPKETRFLPTPADVIAWCEKAVRPMHEEAEREDSFAEQLALRELWQNQVVSESLKANGRTWLDRTDPKVRELTGQKEREARARKDTGLLRIDEANKAVFARECEHDGVDPARGVSPSLLKRLRTVDQEEMAEG
jgi:hypothetical protein